MNNRFEHIDNVFREELGELNVTPDTKAWENITGQLQANKRQRRLIFMGRAAAVFAFAVTLISGYYLSQNIGLEDTESITGNRSAEQSTTTVQPSAGHESVQPTENPSQAITQAEATTGQAIKPPSSPGSQPTVAGALQASPTHETVGVPADESEANDISQHKHIHVTAIEQSMEEIASASVLLEKAASKEATITDPEKPVVSAIHSPGSSLAQPTAGTGQSSSSNDYLDEFAMSEMKEKSNKLKFQLAGMATPIYANVESQNDVIPQNIAFFSTKDGEPEIKKDVLSAYSAGLRFNISKGSRFSVQTGLMYARVDQMHQYEAFERVTLNEESSAGSNNDRIINQGSSPSARPQAGFEFAGSETSFSSQPEQNDQFNQYIQTISDNVEYLEIPVSMRYKVVDRKLAVNVLGGMATNLLIAGERETATGSGVENATDISGNLEKVKYSTHVGVGLEYPLYKQLVFVLEPTVKYYINSLESIHQTKITPLAFGIYTGVNIAF